MSREAAAGVFADFFPVASIDARGGVLLATPAYERINSGPPDAASPLGLRGLHPDDVGGLRALVEDVASTPGAARSSLFRVGDGSNRRVLAVTLANRLDEPGIEGILAELHPLPDPASSQRPSNEATGRVQSRDTCLGADETSERIDRWDTSRRDELLDALLVDVPWGLAILDRDDRVSYASPGLTPWLDILRRAHERTESRVPPALRREIASVLQRVRAAEEAISESEFCYSDPASGTRWVKAFWIDRSHDPLIRGVICVFVDKTEGGALESRYLRAQKLETIEHLTGGLAHDFKNLLGAIIAGLGLVERAPGLEDATREEVRLLQEAAIRASNLTRHLMGLTQPRERGGEVVDVGEVVLSMMPMLRPMLGENITIDVSGADGEHAVRIERGRLEQVILNLCVNARDAMPDGGTIGVEIGRERGAEASRDSGGDGHGAVVLEIRDSGVGMDERVLGQALKPYFTTKPQGVGTGLGLPMVERITSEAGGRLVVASEPGVGTRVQILLPCSEPVAASLPVERGLRLAEAAVERGRLLVVEDEIALQQVQRRMLERAGYEVLTADSVSAAVDIASAEPGRIDLLMTDLVLPDGHGARLAQELLMARPDMRVLFSTGYAPKEAGLDALDAPFPILNKPYTENELLGRVRSILAGAEEALDDLH